MSGVSFTGATSLMLDIIPAAASAVIAVLLYIRFRDYRKEKKRLLEEIRSFQDTTRQKGESL